MKNLLHTVGPKMKRLLILLLLIGIAGCTSVEPVEPPVTPVTPVPTPVPIAPRAQFLTRIMMHDNERRDYFLYVPVNVNPQAGVMFVLHGFGGEARDLRVLGFEELADRLNMMIVYPQGLFNANADSTYWNANFASGDDDFGFLLAIKDELKEEYDVDRFNTYMTGISNGGYMVNAFMCAHPDEISLAINWIGSMNNATYNQCKEPLQVPYLHIHGTADTTIPYDVPTMIPEFDTPGNIAYVVNHIASLNGHTQYVTTEYSVTTTKYEFIDGTARVWLMEVQGMGHVPPIPAFVDFDVFSIIQDFIRSS
jgi:Poly(3-hydroxybutyrate) depolymerase